MVGLVVFGCSVYVCVACITIASRPGWMWILLCGVLVLSHLPTDTQVLSSYMAVALAFLATAATLVANIYLPGRAAPRAALSVQHAAGGESSSDTAADPGNMSAAECSGRHSIPHGSFSASKLLHVLQHVLCSLRRLMSVQSDGSWGLLPGRSSSASGSSRSSSSLDHASSLERACSQACRSMQADSQVKSQEHRPVSAALPATQFEIEPETVTQSQPRMTSTAASRLVHWVTSTSGVTRQSSESAPCGRPLESSQVATILGDTTLYPGAAPSAPSVVCEARSVGPKQGTLQRPGSGTSSELKPMHGTTSTHLAASLTMSRQSSLSSLPRSTHMAATPSGRSHTDSFSSTRHVSPQPSITCSPRGPKARPVQPATQQCGQPWSGVPEAIFQQVLAQLSPSDIMCARLACRDWLHLCSASLTVLQPSQFHASRLSMLFPHLQRLDLSRVTQAVRPSALRQVLCQLRGLQELQLGCNESSSGSGGRRLGAVSCGHAAPYVGDRCMLEVAQQAPGHPKLKSLGLANCMRISDSGLVALASLTSLTSIQLCGCVSITDVGILLLTQLPLLASLDVAWCLKTSNAGLKALGGAAATLTHLDISGCPLITEAGLVSLSSLSHLQHLAATHMGLAQVQPALTDHVLAAWSSLSQLTHFAVGAMQPGVADITDASLMGLPLYHPQLSHLEISCFDLITDAGMLAALAGLHDTLTSLTVRNCHGLTAACLPALRALPRLQALDLLGCTAMEITSQQLLKLLPGPSLQSHSSSIASPDSGVGPSHSAAPISLIPDSLAAAHQPAAAWQTITLTGHAVRTAAMPTAAAQIPMSAELDTTPLLPASWESSSSSHSAAAPSPISQGPVVDSSPASHGHAVSSSSASHEAAVSSSTSADMVLHPAAGALTQGNMVDGDEGSDDEDDFLLPLPPMALPAASSPPSAVHQARDIAVASVAPQLVMPQDSTAGHAAQICCSAPHSCDTAVGPQATAYAESAVGSQTTANTGSNGEATKQISRATMLPLRTLVLGSLSLGGHSSQAPDDACLAVVAQLHSTLECLTLGSFAGSLTSAAAIQALAALTALTALELHGASQAMDGGLANLAQAAFAPRLQRLSLASSGRGTVQWGAGGLRAVVSACTALTHLSLCGCGTSLSNDVVWQIGKSLTHLTSLTITQAPSVTDLGLRMLSNLQHLATLDISRCDRITAHGLFDGPPPPRTPIPPQLLPHHPTHAPPEQYRHPAYASAMYPSSHYNRSSLYDSRLYGPTAPAAGTSWQHSMMDDSHMISDSAAHQSTAQQQAGVGHYPSGHWQGFPSQAPLQHPQQGMQGHYQQGKQGHTQQGYQQQLHTHGHASQAFPTQAYQQQGFVSSLQAGYHPPGLPTLRGLHSTPMTVMVHMRHLRAVSLACSSVDELGVRTLCRHAPAITHLDLSECVFIGDDAVKALTSLKLLISLDLSQCSRLGDVSLSYLAGLTHLATLRVNGCVRLSDEGLAYLTNLPLLMLHMDKCIRVTDAGMHQLAHIPSLTSLRLARCPEISDEGIAALARLTRLSTLSLAHNERITDTGLMALAHITCLAVLEI